MQGARAVRQVIVWSAAQPDISAGIVWVNMLPFDNVLTARFMALSIKAPCVRHFHDPDKQVGKIIAQSLGAQGKVAWDVYLFYPKGIKWDDSPPPPTIWAHQLGINSWADPTYYHRGGDLIEELCRAMEQLTGSGNAASRRVAFS